jgi:succinate dehydrogenase/fumarate reductase flavoprotein subunit
MSEKEQKGIGRRKFLQYGATVGAGAGAASAFAGSVSAAVPETWDRETDVLVVGSGFGGLPAAIEAKRAGADVIVLSKENFAGGISVMSGGHMILGGTYLHKQEGVEDSVEAWYEDEMLAGDYRAIPEIVRHYTSMGDELLRWYEALGIEWEFPRTSYASADVQRVNRSTYPKQSPNYPGGRPASGGISEVYVMLEEADKLGIPILLEHRMTRIYRPGYPDERGPVVGVQVDTPQGTINIRARKGIVLGTGNALGNEQFVKGWEPRMVDEFPGAGDYYHEKWPYTKLTADGHLAASQIGAGFLDMSWIGYLYLRLGTKKYSTWTPESWSDRTTWTNENLPSGGTGLPVAGEGWRRVILVKYDGKRYVNEFTRNDTVFPSSVEPSSGIDVNYEIAEFTRAYMNLREFGKARNVWGIFDADGAEELKLPIEAMQNPDPDTYPSLWPENVAIAETLEELAAKMNIDAAGLKAEIERYNGFVDSGTDEDFGKPGPLHKIEKPPFYAGRLVGVRHTARNGLRTNSKAQVLDLADSWSRTGADPVRSVDEEAVIPGLYAAGEVADPAGWRRAHGSIGIYTIMSITAGRNVAKEEARASL